MGHWRSISAVTSATLASFVAVSGGALAQTASAPLPSGWEAVSFANGCAFVSTGRRPTGQGLYWYGGCRFGLAHGDGYFQQGAGPSGQRRYYYGIPLGTIDGFRPQAPYFFRSNDGYDLSMTDEAGRRHWVHIQRPELNVTDIVAGYVVSVTGNDGSTSIVDVFTPKPLTCTDRGKVNWKGLTVSEADAVAADADCAR